MPDEPLIELYQGVRVHGETSVRGDTVLRLTPRDGVRTVRAATIGQDLTVLYQLALGSSAA
jgi:hypothetical protein